MKYSEKAVPAAYGSLPPEFETIAIDAGQDIGKLRQGESEHTYFRIATMADARRILSQAGPEERVIRSETFLDGLEYRSRIAQGMHDRGEAYVFANHPLAGEKDINGHNNHLPIYVRTLSIPERTVSAGEAWDISVYPQEWGVDEREEMYNIVNVGRLILEPGASVLVRGNALIFTCQECIKTGSRTGGYDIGILGTLHGFGYRRGAFHGRAGDNGGDGSHGGDGTPPRLGSSFLGPLADINFQPGTLDGLPGMDGWPGSEGEAGLNGGACRIAEINIRHLSTGTPLVIGVMPGKGGDGGEGGAGGNGGNGGHGISAIRTIEGMIGPGKAGDGGAGGDGGRGGRAGHGGISSNVFINVPGHASHLIQCYSAPGEPGRSGKGGAPGKGGKAGRAGDGMQPADAEDGQWGRDGKPGKEMPAAKIYLNNRIVDRP